MIDTILMLLVFYMSFSTFGKRENIFGAKLPLMTAARAPAQVPLDIVLHVKDQNDIVVNGATTYDMLGLRDAMMQLTAVGQETTIIIEADPGSSYQDVVSVLDALRPGTPDQGRPATATRRSGYDSMTPSPHACHLLPVLAILLGTMTLGRQAAAEEPASRSEGL